VDKLGAMASAAAPIFAYDVAYIIQRAIMIVLVVIEAVAFVHCLRQRADAFPVVGSLSKQAWLAILGGAILATLLCGVIHIFGFIAVTAAAVYLLDVRPALRDAVDGTGPW
jgi:hypothetical protein